MRHRYLFVFGFAGITGTALACSRTEDTNSNASEVAAREAFVRRALSDDDAGRALRVSSTSEIFFEEGFSGLSYDPPDDFHNHAFRWMGQNGHVRLKSHGGRPMKLLIAGWFHEKVLHTTARLSAFIDGQYIASNGESEDGHYWLETVVPSWMFRGPWVNLVVRVNTVSFHWAEPPDLRVALVYRFEWTEAP